MHIHHLVITVVTFIGLLGLGTYLFVEVLRPGVACYALYKYEEIFVCQAFMFKNAARELYLSKKFCSGNYNKIFFVFVLPCKKKIFILSIRLAK